MMGWTKTLLGLAPLSLLGASCTPALPAPLNTYPTTVDIVDLGVSQPEEGATVRFGWPATAKNPTGKHSRRLAIQSVAGTRDVTVDCDYEYFEASCSRVEMRCRPRPEGVPFTLMLSSDGSMVFNGSSIGSADNRRYWSLVDMNAAERRGTEFREKATRAIQLGPEVLQPSSCEWEDLGDRKEWGAQLSWSQADEASSGELIQAERLGASDREFNLLSMDRGKVYVSVHQAHPEYPTVVAALATAGNLWGKNSGSFERCPLPPTSQCAK